MAMDLNLDKPCEHIDYKLIPVSDRDWDVFILRAPFDGVTIRFGNIAFNGEKKALTFNFEVVDNAGEDDVNVDNIELQDLAGSILQDILDAAVKDGYMVTKDSNGNQSRADDSTQSTN